MEPNWENRTMWTGDNLDIMRGMNSDSVDLIYLDPPFNSNRNYSAPIGSEAAGAAFKDTWTLNDVDLAWHGEIAEQEPRAYAAIDAAGETHGKSMKSYLIMMAVRLLGMRRLLKPNGSIYLHCDPTASHYLKMLMDAVFDRRAFRNEIVWKRTSSHNRAKRWGPIHDTILFYTMNSDYTWNRVLQPLDDDYVERQYRHEDKDGRYRLSDLTGPGERLGDSGQPWMGVDPTSRGRHWELPPDRALPDWFVFVSDYSEMSVQERLDFMQVQGLIYWPEKQDGMPSFKRYLGAHSGAPVQDMVLDIDPLSSSSPENVHYPTQKPLALLERIIEASSNEGDMILDPFCGCATACVAADRLNRQWTGIDLSPLAAQLVEMRMHKEGALLFQAIRRDDIPWRTDVVDLPNYRSHKHTLYGIQEGICVGCQVFFPFRNMTIDHIIPESKGGTDHFQNLQLLCGACNSMKGTTSQEEFIAKLYALGIRAA